MALGRKDVSVARTDSGADILRLAGLLGDDNLIRHHGLVSRIGSESVALRTYSELASLARDLSVGTPKPWGSAGRWMKPNKSGAWPSRLNYDGLCSSAGAPSSCSPSVKRGVRRLNPPSPPRLPAPWSGSPRRTNRAEPQLLRRSVCTRPRSTSRAWRDN